MKIAKHKSIGIGSIIVMTLTFMALSIGGVSAQGDGHPSAKASAQVGAIAIVEEDGATSSSEQVGWQSIASDPITIKTANNMDLIIGVSLECGLGTETLVKSKGGKQDTSTAEAAVQVQVLVDGVEYAAPGIITFCSRTQELSAKFGGVLEQCQDTNGDGIISADECDFTDEELNLMLETMNANHYNFLSADLGTGIHTVEVQTKVYRSSSSQAGDAKSWAFIGNGSVTVEEVRMIKGEDVTL